MTHQHSPKILEWGLDSKANYIATLYGCLDCNETFTEVPEIEELKEEHTHTSYVAGCFTCKLPTLQLSTGDANSNKAMSNKKWNGELDAYSKARAQGIQPAGTRMGQIIEAEKASETLGKAYDAGTMPAAKTIDKSTASVMKEVGL
jgi:hypothetical protein